MNLDTVFTPYVNWMLFFLILPMAVLWAANFHMLWHYRRVYASVVVSALTFSLPWDYYALHAKIWGWPAGCCSLPKILGLPFEEYIFIVVATVYVCTLTLVVRNIYMHHRHHKVKLR